VARAGSAKRSALESAVAGLRVVGVVPAGVVLHNGHPDVDRGA
jgi:hypothetical protein